MPEMPVLETPRLLIRPFVLEDLPAVNQLFDVDLHSGLEPSDGADSLPARAEWLRWTVTNYTQLAHLNQPPYGDRAVVLKNAGQLVGACGFVPHLNAFEQIPGMVAGARQLNPGRYSPEFGLFYAISPAHQRRGFASEAAQALVDYAFQQLRVRRVVATTTYDNHASAGVMRELGMRIERNPLEEPPWLQLVGVIEQGAP